MTHSDQISSTCHGSVDSDEFSAARRGIAKGCWDVEALELAVSKTDEDRWQQSKHTIYIYIYIPMYVYIYIYT